jgi:hypothetical protein
MILNILIFKIICYFLYSYIYMNTNFDSCKLPDCYPVSHENSFKINLLYENFSNLENESNPDLVLNVDGPIWKQYVIKSTLVPDYINLGTVITAGNTSITVGSSALQYADANTYYLGNVVTYNGRTFINLSSVDSRGPVYQGSYMSSPNEDKNVWKEVTIGRNPKLLVQREQPAAAPSMPAPAAEGPSMPAPAAAPSMPAPAAAPSMPAPAGGPSMPAPAGGPSMPAPAGGPSMPPPAGEANMPPPAGEASMPPPAGGPSMPPPAGGPSMPAPAGEASMPPPAGGSNMPASPSSNSIPSENKLSNKITDILSNNYIIITGGVILFIIIIFFMLSTSKQNNK